jgi:hypothetical protein
MGRIHHIIKENDFMLNILANSSICTEEVKQLSTEMGLCKLGD